MRIGVISDTHGQLRDEAVRALDGVDQILHIGDVGKPGILDRLEQIAPVEAVRGNVDTGRWADPIPYERMLELGGMRVYLYHILDDLPIDPEQAGVDVVCYGHSHKPAIDRRDGVLYLNPGSAGPRRFSLPVSVAMLDITDAQANARIVELAV